MHKHLREAAYMRTICDLCVKAAPVKCRVPHYPDKSQWQCESQKNRLLLQFFCELQNCPDASSSLCVYLKRDAANTNLLLWLLPFSGLTPVLYIMIQWFRFNNDC